MISQAIAIGLNEAGASKYEGKKKNRENLKRTKGANDTVQPRSKRELEHALHK